MSQAWRLFLSELNSSYIFKYVSCCRSVVKESAPCHLPEQVHIICLMQEINTIVPEDTLVYKMCFNAIKSINVCLNQTARIKNQCPVKVKVMHSHLNMFTSIDVCQLSLRPSSPAPQNLECDANDGN